jgi:predicted ATP-grasp superfamily ATP-dependent carboligase
MAQAVLVLGNYQQTVPVVRSLARAGYDVLLGRLRRRSYTELSRNAAGIWPHPDPRDKRDFLRALDDLLNERPEIRYVFPIGDLDLDVAATAHEELSRRCRLVMVEPNLLSTCLEKPKMYEAAARIGVPVPESRVIAGDFEALKTTTGEIGFPVILKRPNSFTFMKNQKAAICRDWHAIEMWRQALESGPVVVQRWVGGPRHNCQIAALRGEVFAYFENKNLRTDRTDGTGIGVEWISVSPTPELRRHCEALAKATAYSGVGLIQFLVENGRPFFLELNPRLGMPWELAYRCGLDFAMLALQCTDWLNDVGSAIPCPPKHYAAGKRCYWLLGDLAALTAKDQRTGEIASRIARMVVAFCRADYQLTWSWKDPLPTLFLYASFARSNFSKLLRKFRALWKGSAGRGPVAPWQNG